MHSFQGYCFNDVSELAASHAGDIHRIGGTDYHFATASDAAPGAILILWSGVDSIGGPLNVSETVLTGSCSIRGPVKTDTGMSLADGIELAWMMVAVLLAAWGVNVLRKAL